MGEKLVDRLDFEELALKSIDPSMGPTIITPSLPPSSSSSSLTKDSEEPIKVKVVYPSVLVIMADQNIDPLCMLRSPFYIHLQ